MGCTPSSSSSVGVIDVESVSASRIPPCNENPWTSTNAKVINEVPNSNGDSGDSSNSSNSGDSDTSSDDSDTISMGAIKENWLEKTPDVLMHIYTH